MPSSFIWRVNSWTKLSAGSTGPARAAKFPCTAGFMATGSPAWAGLITPRCSMPWRTCWCCISSPGRYTAADGLFAFESLKSPVAVRVAVIGAGDPHKHLAAKEERQAQVDIVGRRTTAAISAQVVKRRETGVEQSQSIGDAKLDRAIDVIRSISGDGEWNGRGRTVVTLQIA